MIPGMTTATSSTADRVCDWILEPDFYQDDEQELLNRHRAMALAVSVQWILAGSVVAVLAWLGNQALLYGGVTLAVLVYIPGLLARWYVYRSQLRMPMRWTGQRIAFRAVTSVPILVAGLGIAHHNGGLGQALTSSTVVSIAAAALGVGALNYLRRQRLADFEADPTDEE
jgi:hypothetical protein